MIWYYDNGEGPPPVTNDEAHRAGDEWLDVERVYCLDWPRFVEADWRALQDIYASLPGWQEMSSTDLPRWYSSDEDRDLHLWASVEPSGLQVGGVLTACLWRQWDESFRREVNLSGLPRFSCS